jgi:hypothetical protein
VVEQAAEAAEWVAVLVVLGGGFGVGVVGSVGGGDGLSRWGGCSSVKVICAQAWRRCQTRWQASMQISTSALTPVVHRV